MKSPTALTLAFILASFSTFLLTCCAHRDPTFNRKSPKIDSVINSVKTYPGVREVLATDDAALYIAVKEGDSPKQSLLTQLCESFRRENIGLKKIKIVAAHTFKKGNGWASGKVLFHSSCE